MHKISFCIIFILLLLIPALDSRLHIIRRTEIAGVENEFPRPVFRRKEFGKELFQKKFDRWLGRNNGSWGWLVRSSNELNAIAFNQVSTDYKTSVQLGNDGYFFQPMYLRAFNRIKKPPVKLIETKLQNVKKLADLLAARHVPVVVLISPNLLAMYPDTLPQQYIDPARLTRDTSYAVAKDFIQKDNIATVDAYAMLQAKVPTAAARFFQPTGSHWNEVGACLAAEQVALKFDEAIPGKFAVANCSNVTMAFPPPEADTDLIKIANLLSPERYIKPGPVVHAEQSKNETNPNKILLVGTSFLFGLEQQLLRHKTATETELLFYYRERRLNGDPKSSRVLDKSTIDWNRLLSADGIVLEVNQSGPGQIGFGFIEDALKFLQSKRGQQAPNRS